MVAPVLPMLTDSAEALDALLGRIAAAGAAGATVLALHLRPGAREWFQAWLAREHPALVEPYARLYRRGSSVEPAYRRALAERVAPLLRRHGLTSEVAPLPATGSGLSGSGSGSGPGPSGSGSGPSGAGSGSGSEPGPAGHAVPGSIGLHRALAAARAAPTGPPGAAGRGGRGAGNPDQLTLMEAADPGGGDGRTRPPARRGNLVAGPPCGPDSLEP